jgi:hypothetical protein
MTISECEEIVQALKGRAKMEAQFGALPSDTLSGKAAEAIEYLLMELRAADEADHGDYD